MLHDNQIMNRKSNFFLFFLPFHKLFVIMQKDCIDSYLLCSRKLNIMIKSYEKKSNFSCRMYGYRSMQ